MEKEKEAIRLAIVDDEAPFRKSILEFLEKFGAENGFLFQIDTFESGTAFLNEFRSLYDLVLLDVQMPLSNGIEVAKALRAKDSKVAIIFVTNFVQFAPDGYQVHALDYILKPIGYFDFEMKIKKALNSIRHERELNEKEFISFPKKAGLVRIALKDTRYVESVGHNVVFHTLEGEFTKYDSLRHILSQLPKERFLQINSCQVVNMAYVTKIDKTKLFLDSDLFIISHPKKKDVMKTLADFFNVHG